MDLKKIQRSDLAALNPAAMTQPLPPIPETALRRRGSTSALPPETTALTIGGKVAAPRPPEQPRSGAGGASGRSAGRAVAAPAAPEAEADSERRCWCCSKAKAKRTSDSGRKDPLEGKKLQVVSYVLFLAVFVAASFNGRTPEMFWHNSVVESYLSLGEADYTGYEARPSFASISSDTEFWLYMVGGFAPGIFDPNLRVPQTPEQYRTRSQVVYLVSGYRIHQVRVKGEACEIAEELAYLKGATCYPAFADSVEQVRNALYTHTHTHTHTYR
eukprot:COSAG05_NODE_1879_length_3911_cov_4.160283_6_plen_272_part_00